MTAERNSNKAIIGGLGIAYVHSVVQALVYLLYVPLLLRTIGQEEYGLYQFVGSAGAYIVALNTVLSAGLTKFYSIYHIRGDHLRKRNTLAIGHRFILILGFASLGLYAALIVGLQVIYKNSLTPYQIEQAVTMLLILAVDTLVVMYTTSNIAVITANERFVFLKSLQLAILVCQPFVVLILVHHWPSAVTVTASFLAMNLLSAVVQKFYVRNVIRESARFEGYDRQIVKDLLKFFPGVLLVVIADQIFWRADQLIIGYMLDVSAVAVYSIGAQIYKSYMPIGTVVSGVFLPRVSRLYELESGMESISKLFARVGRLAMVLLFLVLSGFCIFGLDFVQLWAGPQYETAFWVAVVVMVPFTVDLVQNLGITVLQVVDKYLVRGVMYLIVALLNVGLTVLLIKPFGIIGAAVSTGLCMFLGSGVFMNWYYSRRLGIDIRFFWAEVAKLTAPLFIYSLIFGLVWYAVVGGEANAISLALAGGAYVAGYLGMSWFFSFRADEKHLVCRFLRRASAKGGEA